ncbi:hypothetical protein [Roseovarius rhodophyticola]|uniref:Uncharacterized protein n=1 Tax=Roseovarius rhodophyticola TaxID=3080827 RepID=A0ABZ2TMZ3_9RHOB|nr:hypothetical protein [Roseovarius sp. W115]MDV2929480.1 hypothetical protein [Roseovarius sp. W115]
MTTAQVDMNELFAAARYEIAAYVLFKERVSIASTVLEFNGLDIDLVDNEQLSKPIQDLLDSGDFSLEEVEALAVEGSLYAIYANAEKQPGAVVNAKVSLGILKPTRRQNFLGRIFGRMFGGKNDR